MYTRPPAFFATCRVCGEQGFGPTESIAIANTIHNNTGYPCPGDLAPDAEVLPLEFISLIQRDRQLVVVGVVPADVTEDECTPTGECGVHLGLFRV